MDAFFASVEQLDDPDLKGKPLIVGGTRGLICLILDKSTVLGLAVKTLLVCPCLDLLSRFCGEV